MNGLLVVGGEGKGVKVSRAREIIVDLGLYITVEVQKHYCGEKMGVGCVCVCVARPTTTTALVNTSNITITSITAAITTITTTHLR